MASVQSAGGSARAAAAAAGSGHGFYAHQPAWAARRDSAGKGAGAGGGPEKPGWEVDEFQEEEEEALLPHMIGESSGPGVCRRRCSTHARAYSRARIYTHHPHAPYRL